MITNDGINNTSPPPFSLPFSHTLLGSSTKAASTKAASTKSAGDNPL